MKALYLIPARGGSKGIPNKNIKLLNGKPLIQYTIEAAQGVTNNNNICVSTDSVAIKEVVEEIGLRVPFLRPPELATDHATSESVMRHALSYYESIGVQYDYIVLLQPTSPFRNSQHLLNAEEKVRDNDLDMLVSVKLTASNPYYVLFEEDQQGLLRKSKNGDFTRRQDCPDVFELNGAIYIISTASLKEKTMKEFDKLVKYEMGEEESLDIDNPMDWLIAEELLKSKSI